MSQPLLEALFSGVRAFVRESVQVAREAVHVILQEIDRSAFGRAATELVKAATARYFSRAEALAEEEAELAEKFKRDGRRSEVDAERLREIQTERSRLRSDLDAAKTQEAAEQLKENQDSVITTSVTDDETSASTGILSAKKCPNCGATMRIRQGGYDAKSRRRSFWWQCTAAKPTLCPTIRLDPKSRGKVIRRPDPDLDGPAERRREIWKRPQTVARTHARLRQGLGEAAPDIVCPHHLLPMKLFPNGRRSGRLLDSYEYVCPGVSADGVACPYTVPVETFPQVSANLRRREGVGIIDG